MSPGMESIEYISERTYCGLPFFKYILGLDPLFFIFSIRSDQPLFFSKTKSIRIFVDLYNFIFYIKKMMITEWFLPLKNNKKLD